MKADHDLVGAADESFIASFRKLAQHVAQGETHEAGSIFSFTTGLPLSGFNGCVVTREAPSAELAASLRGLQLTTSLFACGSPRSLLQALPRVLPATGLSLPRPSTQAWFCIQYPMPPS